ncbi:MAG: hypothetical protein AABX96_00195 [Nanoarchaeota archaeon]
MENNNKLKNKKDSPIVAGHIQDSSKTVPHEAHKDHVHSESKTTETAHTHEHSQHEKTHEHHQDNLKDKKEEVKETPKAIKIIKPKVKKDVAIVRAPSVHMSKRHGMYICSFIKGKSIDDAMKDLEKVILIKKAVPFKGEIPHRKGKGMMSGRYPVAASKIFISILKTLKGNVMFNDMNLEKTRIYSAYTNWASRPQRRGGQKGKRASVFIEAKELNK